jgi:hypothetical protein
VTIEELTDSDLIYQIGVEPVRVDIMSAVPGLTFAKAWGGHVEADFGGVHAPVLSLEDMLVSKRAANRLKNRIQVQQLLEAKRRARGRKK